MDTEGVGVGSYSEEVKEKEGDLSPVKGDDVGGRGVHFLLSPSATDPQPLSTDNPTVVTDTRH